MKLEIKYDDMLSEWTVREVGKEELLYRDKQKRDAFFYARDREDDPEDSVDDIVCFSRDGKVTFGFNTPGVEG